VNQTGETGKEKNNMSELQKSLAWTNMPVPDVLGKLPSDQQEELILWAKNVVALKTDGFEELYHAIGMIVKYIPHFVVVPLMTEHIKPQIAAGVCRKMSIEQATVYANELPIDYFSEVALHLESELLARVLEKMKRNPAETYIRRELRDRLASMLSIAAHLDDRMLKTVAAMVTLPETDEDFVDSPHKPVIEKIRTIQEKSHRK